MPMPRLTYSDSQLIEVATLFYRDRLLRKAIAMRMNTDIRGVTHMLDLAHERRLVQIQISETVDTSLADRLQKAHPHLQRVLIVGGIAITKDSQEELYLERIQRFASVAATHFDEIVEGHAGPKPLQVGVTGGESCLELANALSVRPRNVEIHATSVIPHGDVALTGSHVDPSTNATIMWSRSGRLSERCHYVTATPYTPRKSGPVARKRMQDEIAALSRNEHVKKAIGRLADLDVAVVGVGILEPPVLRRTLKDRLTMTSLLEHVVDGSVLCDEGAIGDVSYCLLDRNGEERPVDSSGKPLPRERWRMFITAGHYETKLRGAQFYSHMVDSGKPVIAIAGPFKAPAIRAALKARVFSVLVTDEHTIRQLLREGESGLPKAAARQ